MAKEIIDIDQIQQSYDEHFLPKDQKIERAIGFLLSKELVGYSAQKVANWLKPIMPNN